MSRISRIPPRCILVVLFNAPLIGCRSIASEEWPYYQHDALRTASQLQTNALSDPSKAATLHELWRWHPAQVGDQDVVNFNIGFSASPVVHNDMIYVGHLNGHLYALNTSGAMVWKFPPAGQPPLVSKGGPNGIFNPSSPGIASSASVVLDTTVQGQPAVVFSAPDPSSNLGDGVVWAVNANTGTLIWKSPVLAQRSANEQLSYDSPLIVAGRVYAGVASYGDQPIIAGKLFALDLQTGQLLPGFTTFIASAIRGGGIWSSPAATPRGDVVITTGNSCRPDPNHPQWACNAEPNPSHAPSMLQLVGATGALYWEFHPVPWSNDGDDDWAATPAVSLASCGTFAISQLKDGFTHAIVVDQTGPQLGTAVRRWTFPEIPFGGGFGGEYALHPMSLWNDSTHDVAIGITGGWDINIFPSAGLQRLYALNICRSNRVRWWRDFNARLGPASQTHGIVYVGDSNGFLHVIADPDRRAAVGQHCEFPGLDFLILPGLVACTAFGYREVPVPAELKRIPLIGAIRTTPALAREHVYVTTDGGFVFALVP